MRLVVIQPTSRCNLNCRYCYVPNRQDKSTISDDHLETLFEKLFESEFLEGHTVEFLWHCGEPLLVGIDFYKKAIGLIEKFNKNQVEVKQSIQTNGLLLDKNWCEFFRNERWNVGLSVDGPEFLHDLNRRSWNDKPSHSYVMEKHCLMRSEGITTGALCVLTHEHLKYPEDIIEFFASHHFPSVGFNIEEIENANTSSTLHGLSGRLDPEMLQRFSEFASRLYDAWKPYQGSLEVREFQDFFNVAASFLEDGDYVRNPDEVAPLGIITIHKNGDISTYSPEFAGAKDPHYNDFVITNVAEVDFSELQFHPNYLRIFDAVERHKQNCRSNCIYYPICGGAYVSNAYFESGLIETRESTACKLLRQVLTDVLIEKLKAQSI